MESILQELTHGWPDAKQLAALLIRLVLAMALGAVVGYERERAGKPAGLRTHMLVSMGGALIILACLEFGMNADGISRVLQGLVTGIGFLGGGAILKLQEQERVEGLTTAAGIWLTAAVGITVGLGREGLAVIGIVLAWITLALIGKLEKRIAHTRAAEEQRRR